MSTNQLRLADLLARQVDVQWFEGVAIVQAVCRQLLATGASNDEFPGATQIGISADGAVRLLATTPTKAVPAAAHLLAGLLSDDVPVRLRLAVSQATGQGATIQSLREFSEILGYFERPDTELIVRTLFDRAMLAGVRKQTDEPRLDNVGTDEKRKPAVKPSPNSKAIWRRAAMAATVVITIGAASWLGLSAARGGRVSAAVTGIVNAVAGAPEARVNEPLEKSTASKETATNGPTRLQRTHSSTANSSHRQPGEARKESARSLGVRIPSLVPSLTSVMAPMPMSMPSRNAANATEIAQTYVIVASEPNKGGSDQIYSKSDFEVTPPRQVYPALPAEPPAALMSRALTVVDLVIAPDGVVERVRLRTTPRDIHEFMLLSAAKAWRFEPALLDGRPVRFLHSVALTSFK
jgi:hypothetical protein